MKKTILAAALFVLGLVAVAPSITTAANNAQSGCCTTGAACCPDGPCCK